MSRAFLQIHPSIHSSVHPFVCMSFLPSLSVPFVRGLLISFILFVVCHFVVRLFPTSSLHHFVFSSLRHFVTSTFPHFVTSSLPQFVSLLISSVRFYFERANFPAHSITCLKWNTVVPPLKTTSPLSPQWRPHSCGHWSCPGRRFLYLLLVYPLYGGHLSKLDLRHLQIKRSNSLRSNLVATVAYKEIICRFKSP